MLHTHTHHPNPSLLDQAAAPLARGVQRVQDSIAQCFGFRNSGNMAAIVGVIGLTTMAVASALGPLAPAAYGAGLWTAKAGALGLGENHVTERVANWDGKGEKI